MGLNKAICQGIDRSEELRVTWLDKMVVWLAQCIYVKMYGLIIQINDLIFQTHTQKENIKFL